MQRREFLETIAGISGWVAGLSLPPLPYRVAFAQGVHARNVTVDVGRDQAAHDHAAGEHNPARVRESESQRRNILDVEHGYHPFPKVRLWCRLDGQSLVEVAEETVEVVRARVLVTFECEQLLQAAGALLRDPAISAFGQMPL